LKNNRIGPQTRVAEEEHTRRARGEEVKRARCEGETMQVANARKR